jgi:hypothetical protein
MLSCRYLAARQTPSKNYPPSMGTAMNLVASAVFTLGAMWGV